MTRAGTCPDTSATASASPTLVKILRIIEAVSDEHEPPPTIATATLPADYRRLRGLPAIGRGVSGAVSGSQPEAEALRRLSQRARST